MHKSYLTPLIFFALASHVFAADLEWVRVADDGKGFVLGDTGTPFVPWGFNDDHQEGSGRLIEDYWNDQWATVEEDFQEMKQPGANIVRMWSTYWRLSCWLLVKASLTQTHRSRPTIRRWQQC